MPNARTAEAVRLLVDDRLCGLSCHPNKFPCMAGLLEEITRFVGARPMVVAGPAGMFTAQVLRLEPTLPDIVNTLRMAVRSAQAQKKGWQNAEMLVGLDLCAGHGTPNRHRPSLQTLVRLPPRGEWVHNAAIKLHPARGEELAARTVCQELGHVPDGLIQVHTLTTCVGTLLVLVCHEAVLFTKSFARHLRDSTSLAVRQRLWQMAANEPRPGYMVLASHCQSSKTRCGTAFQQTAQRLADISGATVLLTMHAHARELAEMATRCAGLTPNSPEAATLLVHDAGSRELQVLAAVKLCKFGVSSGKAAELNSSTLRA